jgi:hypothetical protein
MKSINNCSLSIYSRNKNKTPHQTLLIVFNFTITSALDLRCCLMSVVSLLDFLVKCFLKEFINISDDVGSLFSHLDFLLDFLVHEFSSIIVANYFCR